MRKSELRYDLPPDLIAQHPCIPRDAARLLVLHRSTGRIEHRVFRDLPEYLLPADCMVLNTTKVLPARFDVLRATGGRIEGLFLREETRGQWEVMFQGAGRLRIDEQLRWAGGPWVLTLRERLSRGHCLVSIDPPNPPEEVLARVGRMPVPPYIGRDCVGDARDDADYQTVFAAQVGAVAAPTAGLHFTPELLARIEKLGVARANAVLHVGPGTFSPIETDDLGQHRMHAEYFELSHEAAVTIEAARNRRGRIVAIGTTSVRVLESYSFDGPLRAQTGWTDIFIYAPYEFRRVDAMVTNFHLPESTLLALVFAFAGRERVLSAYEAAIRERYRFFSYGDAMLIL